MEDKARPEDYRLLGIAPEADEAELDRGYHRVKALYSEGSLATYSMMDEEEREAMRSRIEEAHLRVSVSLARRREAGFAPAPGGEPPAAAVPAPAPAQDLPPAPAPSEPPSLSALDGSQPPGPQLRRMREDRGITLKEISLHTRIRSAHFANIEEGNLAELPAAVYLRGFVIEYARRLGFADPEAVASHYLAWTAKQAPSRE